MKPIFADFIRYNANSRNNRVGDCVKRALSVAYSMDYDEVSRELNRIKNTYGHSEYNQTEVFTKFVKARGDQFTKLNQSDYITVQGFADEHPSGVYLLLTGKNPANKYTTHLEAVVDGNIYDSWDSREYYVKEVCKVSQGKSDVYELDGNEIASEVAYNVYQYVYLNLHDKQPSCMDIGSNKSTERDDKYTHRLYVWCKLGDVPDSCKYWSNRTYGHYIIIKMNPRLSREENVEVLTKKCKQKAYDWVAGIRDNITTALKAESIQTHDSFRGSKELLTKCPDWAVPYINWAFDRGSGDESWPRYEIDMDALLDDPRYEERYTGKHVHFEANTLKELKWQFQQYKDHFYRLDYDY